jgi:signal transduction histidine kinase/CheY-like chemotaxis protein
MRLLLVEDCEDDALLIRESLCDANIQIEHADRLSSAFERLAGCSFDAVLLDLSLPDAQGLESIRRVRSEVPRIPIVVLTGLNDEEMAVKAVEHGAQDYLIKGQVDGPLLTRSLRYAVQRHKAEETLKERNRELLALRTISETTLASLELQPVLEKILEQAILIGSFDLGNIRLLDASREMLEVVVTRGYRDPQNVLSHRTISKSPEAAHSSHFKELIFMQTCIEEHVPACRGLRTFKKERVESFLQVPVRAEGDVLGIIQLASRTPRCFRTEEVNLLETIGNQMGIAVQRSRLYQQTREQAQQLEKANRMQADFVAMIAHDLRSPLMNICGAAEVMSKGIFGDVTVEQARWLGRIIANSHNLINLVSDFLDVSKLEAGYVILFKEMLDLPSLIEKSVENFLIPAQEKQISLKKTLPLSLPAIDADRRRMDQVFSNLFSNAIKFTPHGGNVEVGAEQSKDGLVQFWVQDDGIGIPAGEIAHVFDKYRQCSNADASAQKGTGLGLVICKMVVQAHGGRIWVESEEGRGSTFYVSLPLQADEKTKAEI